MIDVHPRTLPERAHQLVDATAEFLTYIEATGCSPNTIRAYAHDLAHLSRFLLSADIAWQDLTPERAVDLLVHLHAVPGRRRGRLRSPSVAVVDGAIAVPGLSPATINRVLVAVSSFYNWARMAGWLDGANPMVRIHDHAAARAAERHRSFLTGSTGRQPIRNVPRMRTVRRLPGR
jgi:integrase/recombinase XerD